MTKHEWSEPDLALNDEARMKNSCSFLVLVLVIESKIRNQGSDVGGRRSEGKAVSHGFQFQGLNPIRGLGDGAGRAGGSMMSMTRCKIVTMTAS